MSSSCRGKSVALAAFLRDLGLSRYRSPAGMSREQLRAVRPGGQMLRDQRPEPDSVTEDFPVQKAHRLQMVVSDDCARFIDQCLVVEDQAYADVEVFGTPCLRAGTEARIEPA